MIPAAPGAAPQAGEAIRGLRLGGNLDRARGNKRYMGTVNVGSIGSIPLRNYGYSPHLTDNDRLPARIALPAPQPRFQIGHQGRRARFI
jgi:hypothetical protein